MAPEVRLVPLWMTLALIGTSLPLSPSTLLAQQNKPPAEKESSSESKARLLQELDRQIEERRKELAREEEALVTMKRALEAAKQELVKEKDRLEELRGQVESGLGKRTEAGDERLDQVAKVYAAMKPKAAAEALESMDEDLAVSILEKLPNRTVGKVFDLMSKDRVRKLTARLERGRSVGSDKGER